MMEYDNNDMDKKLRQLENQSLPDLSKMDEQWAKMKAVLVVPGGQSNGRSLLRKPGLYIIAAIFIGALFFVFYINNHKQTESKKEYAALPVLTDTPSAKIPDSTVITQRIIIKNPAKIKLPAYKIIPLQEKVVIKDTVKVLEAPPGRDVTNEKASLEKFFKEVEKPAQVFVINPTRDTMITGKDGSALLILANTFDSKDNVTIELKEYYSYKDIITNRLTTSSNGEQLVTGGMLHITALSNGKDVNIQPDKSIRWFIPDTTAAIKQMQLFTGTPETKYTKLMGDTLATNAGFVTYNNVNWISQPRFFTDNYVTTKVKVLDLRDEPKRERDNGKKKVGVFRLSDKSAVSKEELANQLKAKYGYTKVKIKSSIPLLKGRSRYDAVGRDWIPADGLGDSIWVTLQTAKIYKLQGTDTMNFVSPFGYNTTGSAQKFIKDVSYDSLLTSASKQFSIDIRTLGWINCDRFLNDQRNKVQFFVDLKDSASNYFTVLVFDNMKSMMTGAYYGNKIMFQHIPEGETATLISIGIQHGKIVGVNKQVQVSKTTLSDLSFEEITPAAFKEQASAMDK